MSIETMKEKITATIAGLGTGVSLTELSNRVEGFKGDYVWHGEDRNVIIWMSISPEACKAMIELIQTDQIEPSIADVLTYFIDGGPLPKLPLAASIGRKYKKPHWLPLCFKPGKAFKRPSPEEFKRWLEEDMKRWSFKQPVVESAEEAGEG